MSTSISETCSSDVKADIFKKKYPKGLLVLYILAQGVGISCICLVLHWCIIHNGGFHFSGKSFFSWHPIFMVTGVIYFSGCGIVTFRVFRSKRKNFLKYIHAFMNAVGLVCASLGIKSIYTYLMEERAPNLFTVHSWVGAFTIAMYFSQVIGGLLAFLLNWFSHPRKAAYLPIHMQMGNFVFLLAIATALIGLNEKAIWSLGNGYKARVAAAWVINCTGLLLVVFGGLIYSINARAEYKRLPQLGNIKQI